MIIAQKNGAETAVRSTAGSVVYSTIGPAVSLAAWAVVTQAVLSPVNSAAYWAVDLAVSSAVSSAVGRIALPFFVLPREDL